MKITHWLKNRVPRFSANSKPSFKQMMRRTHYNGRRTKRCCCNGPSLSFLRNASSLKLNHSHRILGTRWPSWYQDVHGLNVRNGGYLYSRATGAKPCGERRRLRYCVTWSRHSKEQVTTRKKTKTGSPGSGARSRTISTSKLKKRAPSAQADSAENDG